MKSLATRVLDRLLLVVYRAQTEDPGRVKPTIERQRPTDQAVADAITGRHATMSPPPPSHSPEPVKAQVSEVCGETKGAPVDTMGDRIADSGPESPKAPATPHATLPGDDGRRTSSRPPPPVTVLAPPPAVTSGVTDAPPRFASGAMRTMAFGMIDSLLLVVIGPKPIDDDSWRAFLALVAQQGADDIRILYVTEGPQPTTEQRHQLEDILGGRMVPACVVSDGASERTTTITLSAGRVLAFPLAETRLALAHLGVPWKRRPLALDMIRAKRAEIARSAASAPERAR